MQSDRAPPIHVRLNNALRRLMNRGPVGRDDIRLLERHGLIERRSTGLALSEAGRVRLRAMPLIVTRRRDDPVEAVLSKYAAGIERLRPSERRPEAGLVEPDKQPAPTTSHSATDTRRWIALARSRIERT